MRLECIMDRGVRRAATERVAEKARKDRHRIICGCRDGGHCGPVAHVFAKTAALYCNCRGSVRGNPKIGRGCCRGNVYRPAVISRMAWRADRHRLMSGGDAEAYVKPLCSRTIDRRERRPR